MDDAERAQIVGWLLQPNMDAVNFVVDELKLLSTVHRSLVAMSGMPQLLMVAKQYSQEKGLDPAALAAFDRLSAESPAGFAQEYVAGDFALPNAHGLVGTWGVVESSIEETVVNLLRNVGPSRLGTVDPKLATTPGVLDEVEARALYPRIERRFRDGRSAAEAYTAIFSHYDIHVSCAPDIYTTLSEVNEIRNCLLHRGGVIDEKACRKAPQLRPLLGTRIAISSQTFGLYTDAIHTFIVATTRGITQSPFLKP